MRRPAWRSPRSISPEKSHGAVRTALNPPGVALAPLCRGSCHGNAVTEGVYAIDTVKAIV